MDPIMSIAARRLVYLSHDLIPLVAHDSLLRTT